MTVKTKETTYTGHADFIRSNSTLDEATGLRTMPKSAFYTLSEQDGVTKELLEAANRSQEMIIGAGIHVVTEDLKGRIEAAREAGDDTSMLKSTLRISTPGGSTEIDVRATRTSRNPRTGDPITKHGVVDVSIDAKKRIPHDAADHARHVVTRALGLTLETGEPLKIDV